MISAAESVQLRCVAVVNGRTATGLVPVRRDLWEEMSEAERDEWRMTARREFQRASRVQLGVELTDEEISAVRVLEGDEMYDPIPVAR